MPHKTTKKVYFRSFCSMLTPTRCCAPLAASACTYAMRALRARLAVVGMHGHVQPSPRLHSARAFSHDADPNLPLSTVREPVRVAVTAGQVYRWCACGRSTDPVWCDGASHKRTTIRPVVYRPEKSGLVSLCGCRLSVRRPLCDGGSHNAAGVERRDGAGPGTGDG